MLRAYGEKRRVYVIIPKEKIKKDQALKMAAVELHEKVDSLEISFATLYSTTDEDMTFLVERKSGQFWCISRKGNK